MKADSILNLLSPLVTAIAQTFGSRCEVVLHDLRHLDRSVIKIENGHVTGRRVGSSVIDGRVGDKGLKLLKKGMTQEELVNYASKSRSGKALKSTTVLFRNEKNEAVVALCINLDISDMMSASTILNDFCRTENDSHLQKSNNDDIVDTALALIENEVTKYPCSVAAMKKQDRVKIVSKLYEQGVFGAKGIVKIVANKLNVSKYAIYTYLEEIKS